MSTTCFSSVIPDVCHRESMSFESIVFSGYPIKTFGYDRGGFGYDRGISGTGGTFGHRGDLRAQNREGSRQQLFFVCHSRKFVAGIQKKEKPHSPSPLGTRFHPFACLGVARRQGRVVFPKRECGWGRGKEETPTFLHTINIHTGAFSLDSRLSLSPTFVIGELRE